MAKRKIKVVIKEDDGKERKFGPKQGAYTKAEWAKKQHAERKGKTIGPAAGPLDSESPGSGAHDEENPSEGERSAAEKGSASRLGDPENKDRGRSQGDESVNVDLANFLKAVTEENYAGANKYLRGAVDKKLVNAIRNSAKR